MVDTVVAGAIPFLAVLCFISFYGQQHRRPSADTYGTVMTAVALVQQRTIYLDDYLPYVRQRSGQTPYMLTVSESDRPVNGRPLLPSLLAVPAVLTLDLAGTAPGEWDRWMEAGMLTAAILATLSVLVLFVLATRLTTRRRAFVVACVYAFGTLTWGVAGQALWQHSPAVLALTVGLLALNDRRFMLAGAALALMVASRPSTPIIAALLLPLLGTSARAWGRFALGAAPVALAYGAYNTIVFGSPLSTGYTTGSGSIGGIFAGNVLEGLSGVLVAPGRGLFVYSPVLLFALLGAARGFGVPLYRWAALAALAYTLLVAQTEMWWGGESFGPRLLTDVLPLLAVLLIPALDAVAARTWLRWAFGVALAWSVTVQLLGTAAWTSAWYDMNFSTTFSTWWSLTSNELVSILERSDLASRLGEAALVLGGALALGFTTAWLWVAVRRRARTRADLGSPAR